MTKFYHSEKGILGTMVEENGYCTETVERKIGDKTLEQIHSAYFPASTLGNSDRTEYVRVMTRSIIEQKERELKNQDTTTIGSIANSILATLSIVPGKKSA